MGILIENLDWMMPEINNTMSMLELGNQYLYISCKPYESFPDKFVDPSGYGKISAKKYFQELGYDHTSIDLNGQDDALNIDLSTAFNLNKQFDITTDYGTSEHVKSLYNCLLNIHNHTKPGGKIFHVNPLTNNWPDHGYWYRDEEFYFKYIELTGYKINSIKTFPACRNIIDGYNIWCFLEKTPESIFPNEDDFNKLPIKLK